MKKTTTTIIALLMVAGITASASAAVPTPDRALEKSVVLQTPGEEVSEESSFLNLKEIFKNLRQ